ncbi:MAG: 50S ribosomal protein L29 [Dehalococcoidia bacterium]|nr:50S ribosomal protein L29 [Dehalococcoidia bacterium]
MRAHEIREMDYEELKRSLEESYRELMNIRFRLATKQMANTSQVRYVKRNIARLQTIIRQRELGES